MQNSDLSENLITRGSIYEPFLTWRTPSEEPHEVHFFEKYWNPKIEKHRRNIVFSNMSEINFPELGTLRLVVWTIYSQIFNIF